MKILKNENLAKYTTFKIGGIAKKIYIPESVSEIIECTKNNPSIVNYKIGGGSNLLINDKKIFDEVLLLRNFNNEIKHIKNGKFYVGASVKLQKLINEINIKGYGGIEYLYSVPGLVGGAIFMNAGRGKKHNKSISDYIEKVEYIENGTLKEFSKEDCCFSYRKSIFQSDPQKIITGVYFNFGPMKISESKKRIKERIKMCKEKQDMSNANFGTVFSESNKYIIKLMKFIKIGNKKGITFSKKTSNWMLNNGNGTYKEAEFLINFVKKLHKIFNKKCELEVRIWK